MVRVFNFYEQLDYAERYSHYLNSFYTKIYPVKSIEIIYDKILQKKGVDKILHMENKDIKIDEKIESIKATKNIVFEDKVDIDNDISGWLETGVETDIVTFYQVKVGKIYMIPHKDMKEMYTLYKEDWLKNNQWKIIYNDFGGNIVKGRIFLVPKQEVFDFLHNKNNIKWEEFEFDASKYIYP